MNCGDFEKIVVDLARLQKFDPVLRNRALTHSENCARCAARLTGEQTIGSALKALEAEDRPLCASTQIEAGLLAAFRQQNTPQVINLPERRPTALPLWALAAAAAVILALGLTIYRAQRPVAEEGPTAVLRTPATVAPTDDLPIKTGAARSSTHQATQKTEIDTPRQGRRRLQPAPTRRDVGSKQNRILIKDGMTLYGGESNTATDFLPLVYAANLPQLESGQLVRVRIPRSALVKFGLPVNVELSDIPVNADLLVGDDGLARAIRFVR